MSDWNRHDLDAFISSEDVHISPLRSDGVTHGTPTRIWAVVVGNNLYVRPASGPTSRWYIAAIKQGAGRISVAGHTHNVTFHQASADVLDAIDSAYQASFDDTSSVTHMIGAGPRSASVRVTKV
jgi:hypothetical protein